MSASRQEQINEYRALTAAHEQAQRAENDARIARYNAGSQLEKRLLSEVDRAKALNQEIMYEGERCLVVDLRTNSWAADVVIPVVLRKIKTGAWGKTRAIANRLHWDFDTCTWVQS